MTKIIKGKMNRNLEEPKRLKVRLKYKSTLLLKKHNQREKFQ